MPQNDDITALLQPGETLLWHGRPDVGRLVGAKLAGCFLAGAGVGLSLLWAWYAAARGTAVGLFVALLFLALGLGVGIAKTREVLAARTTRYAITDRRALIVSGRTMAEIRDFAPDDIGPLETCNLVHGVGDLLFHHVGRIRGFGGWRTESRGFIGIAEIGKAREALIALNPDAANRTRTALAPDVSLD